MPHAALWVVQRCRRFLPEVVGRCFNAARGFVGGAAQRRILSWNSLLMFQCRTRLCGWCSRIDIAADRAARDVSMPHAALWVVQLVSSMASAWVCNCFNAARGFVGGAAAKTNEIYNGVPVFQCRTRLCGWCSLVALSSFPPRGKKHFWKVSGNSRVLTENM